MPKLSIEKNLNEYLFDVSVNNDSLPSILTFTRIKVTMIL